MRLSFPSATVRRLLQHTKEAARHAPLHKRPKTRAPGLWLIGDDGVYLMSNGQPGLLVSDNSDQHVVAYARGINPNLEPFDLW